MCNSSCGTGPGSSTYNGFLPTTGWRPHNRDVPQGHPLLYHITPTLPLLVIRMINETNSIGLPWPSIWMLLQGWAHDDLGRYILEAVGWCILKKHCWLPLPCAGWSLSEWTTWSGMMMRGRQQHFCWSKIQGWRRQQGPSQPIYSTSWGKFIKICFPYYNHNRNNNLYNPSNESSTWHFAIISWLLRLIHWPNTSL